MELKTSLTRNVPLIVLLMPCDSGEIYNLNSGVPAAEEMVSQMLGVKEVGQTCYQNFLQTSLKNDNKTHDPIKEKSLYCSKTLERKFLFTNTLTKSSWPVSRHCWHGLGRV